MNTLKTLCTVSLIGSAMVMSSAAFAGERNAGRDLHYKPTVFTDLSQKGNFQQLESGVNELKILSAKGGSKKRPTA